MGEGSGALVLESLEHALARGVGAARGASADDDDAGTGGRIYAEIVGYGLSCDAHHITSPPPDGDGALRCMRAALADARVPPSALDYISAHATSTPLGDEIELRAIGELLAGGWCAGAGARRTAVSSTKGATGHLLGAAGAVEAALSVLAVHRRLAPPCANLDDPVALDEGEAVGGLAPPPPAGEKPFELIDEPRGLGGGGGAGSVVALSNSFGFGGTNASLVFRSFGGVDDSSRAQ